MQYFLRPATISTADAQRWRVVGTSVAGIKAGAIGRIFDIPEGQYEVSPPGRPYRTNSEGVKTSLLASPATTFLHRRFGRGVVVPFP